MTEQQTFALERTPFKATIMKIVLFIKIMDYEDDSPRFGTIIYVKAVKHCTNTLQYNTMSLHILPHRLKVHLLGQECYKKKNCCWMN